MTCIVGIIHPDLRTITLGSDTLGSSAYSCESRLDSKIFTRGNMLFGGAGSFRMINILKYELELPEHQQTVSTDAYMNTVFIRAVRKLFKKHGFLRVSEGIETFDGIFMVGYRGCLYIIDSDFQLAIATTPYTSIGSGQDVAKGSLYSTDRFDERDRLRIALEASEQFVPSVRGPFEFLTHNSFDLE